VRVAVFAEGAEAQEAIAAGADVVGADDLIDKIKESMHSFLSTYVLRSLFMVEGVNLGDTIVFDEGWTIEQIKLELPTGWT
jgi:ribosomal protein L1